VSYRPDSSYQDTMKKFFIFITFLHLLVSPNTYGIEIPILKVISEPEDNLIYSIFLILDTNGEIQKLKRQERNSIEIYEFKKIIEGVVLLEMEKREVLFMECPNCDGHSGGEIMIRFLKNGITHQYSEIFFDLEQKNRKWGLFKSDGSIPIKTLTLKANKLLGKVIGIKEIEINSR
jgi:hypothetical protein